MLANHPKHPVAPVERPFRKPLGIPERGTLRKLTRNFPATRHRSMGRKILGLMLVVAGACQLLLALAHAQGSYFITDLGTLGGDSSQAYGLNAFGQVTGVSETAGNAARHAFLYYNGRMQDLGTLGGTNSSGRAVNNLGQVVGDSDLPGDAVYHAFIYQGGRLQDLSIPGSLTYADGVNDLGQVVGYFVRTLGDAVGHAFLSRGGRVKELGTLPGLPGSIGRGINDLGEVAVTCYTPYSPPAQQFVRAALYRRGSLQDLGTLGGPSSLAEGINNLGQVVGVSDLPGVAFSHAFLYREGRMKDLGTLEGIPNSEAHNLNDFGEVVGEASTDDGSVVHAFVYRGDRMQDLNDLLAPNSGWVLQSAWSVNDAGQIVGWGIHNGQTRAFLLTPHRWH
jgi:probable HAF family extracellular repeat protein